MIPITVAVSTIATILKLSSSSFFLPRIHVIVQIIPNFSLLYHIAIIQDVTKN